MSIDLLQAGLALQQASIGKGEFAKPTGGQHVYERTARQRTEGDMMNQQYTLTTTRDLLRENHACESGYRKLLKSLGGAKNWPKDKPINLLRVLESNGVPDALWCLRATAESSLCPRVLIAADIAESVLHIFTAKYPTDDRPAKAIQAARDVASGKITAAAAAAAAADADAAAADAAAATADAAAATADAAAAAATADAAYAADAADAAYAAYAAARTMEREKQANIIRKWLK